MTSLCVSMLCWEIWDDQTTWKDLRECGVSELEWVPTKVWPGWEGFSKKSAVEASKKLSDAGFSIPAAQSLAFGIPDIAVFGSNLEGGSRGATAQKARSKFLEHLEKVFEVGHVLGVRRYVFGSPGLRRKLDMRVEDVQEIAYEFFTSAGNLASDMDAVIALEANAQQYGCDWLTTTNELDKFVSTLAHVGVGLHLDVGNMMMMEESLRDQFARLLPNAVHFHLSSPFMAPVDQRLVQTLSTELEAAGIGYPDRVSLEQKYVDEGAFQASLTSLVSVLHWGV